ncbi:MAG TPA: sugar phosphate isomerase/epimerase family protein [Verrucomicrobiota bacterium]|nr:sugar phosphate isomerase/epimerase family protein [Verrucomicrobiota bacterium]
MNTQRMCLLLSFLIAAASAVIAAPIPEECRTAGFAIGCQGWTFNRFTVMEAIDKTAEAGGKVIELYPGQRFSTNGTARFDHNATDEQVEQVKARLAQRGVRAVNYGVVSVPRDEAEARKVFEFAKKMGLYAITTESVDAMDTIEKLVKEYDIRVGIHNHPRRRLDSNYKVWDPKYVLEVVKGRDRRIGAAADTGHWVRSGLVPVECLKILEGRIVSVHLKDLDERSPGAQDVPYGSGVSDIPGILEELRRQKFEGNISVEYENKWENNVADAAQCIGFVRGYGTANKW